jgi:DNA helicase HerA-like ATPase
MSWRKFKRVITKALNNAIFSQRVVQESNEERLRDSIVNIQKNEVHVVDIARLDQDTQAFVFGDVIRAIYELKLGQEEREEREIPSKIVIFIDELNKYASNDVPKNSPILKQILDISERGRSLGIILFSVEQFKSAIHDRVKGNCASHAFGRTNAIEISKADYRFVPTVYKNMMTRLDPGEYIIEHPVFRSLLNIKFPKPLYKQFPNG